jgi:hypothetical protein
MMRQRISATIETNIATSNDEIRDALAKLSLTVIDVQVGKPYQRNPDRDGVS